VARIGPEISVFREENTQFRNLKLGSFFGSEKTGEHPLLVAEGPSAIRKGNWK